MADRVEVGRGEEVRVWRKGDKVIETCYGVDKDKVTRVILVWTAPE